MKRIGMIVTFLTWIGTTFGLFWVIGCISIKFTEIKEENIRLKSKYEFFEREA